jgi:hypothetical protein
MHWTHGHWLDTKKLVLLPATATYLSPAMENEEALCQMTSNGLAAGVGSRDPARSSEFDFLRAAVLEPPPAETDVRIAIAELTTPELQDSPFRVVRAVARVLQPIHYGAGFERALTSQVQARLGGRRPNAAPIPVC